MNREPDNLMNILFADDDEDDRFLFISAFEEINRKVVIHAVADGDHLMKYLERHQDNLPDMLFLDLNLIRKNGMECLREIRSQRIYDEMTITIYSTSAAEREIKQAAKLGANLYIKKPNDFNSLITILQKACSTDWRSGSEKEFVLGLQ
jgi:CheY-like chemotaxis protein